MQACLQTVKKYGLWAKLPTMPFDKNEMVEKVTEQFASVFQNKWGGKQISYVLLQKFLVLHLKRYC